MISNWGDREANNNNNDNTCIQSFDSVAPHLELAILSRKFRITKQGQSSVVDVLKFFLQKSVQVCKI